MCQYWASVNIRLKCHESFWLIVFCKYIYSAIHIQSITTVKYLACFLVTDTWLLFFAFASVSDCDFWIHVVIHIIKERELTGFDYSAKTIMVLWHLQCHSLTPPENVHVNNRILALREECIIMLVLNSIFTQNQGKNRHKGHWVLPSCLSRVFVPFSIKS